MALNYNIKGTGVTVSDEIRSYVEKRLAHATKFMQGDSTEHVDIELHHQTTEDRQKYRAELTLSLDGDVYRAESFGDTLHEAIDIASNELAKELSRTTKKRQRMVRRGASKFKDFIKGFRRGV